MYNLRVKHFCDSIQIQYFDKPVIASYDAFDERTGEIIERKRSDGCEDIVNPFTGEVERVKIIPDNIKLARMADNNFKRAKNVIYDLARSNHWEWFLTFTFSPDFTNRYDYSECGKKLSKWLNNVKSRGCYDMCYLIVPEQHKDGAWHFHGLFSNCDGLDFVYSGKHDKKGHKIYNVGRYKWGFTTATQVGDSGASASYLCKYVTKDLVELTKGKKRYWASKNCKRPVVTDYLIEDKLIEFLKSLDVDVKSMKKVETPYNYVTYVEV